MSVGGSDWVTRTQCDAGMLALTPMWKVIDNEVFPWALSILVEDERWPAPTGSAAHRRRPPEHRARPVPGRRRRVPLTATAATSTLQDGKAICCLCGLEGEIHNEGGKYSFTFPAEQLSTPTTPCPASSSTATTSRRTPARRLPTCRPRSKARQAAYRLYHRHRAREGLRRRVRDVRPIRSVIYVDVCREEYRHRLQHWAVRPPYSGFHLQLRPYVTKYAFYNALPVPPEGSASAPGGCR